MLSFAHPAWFAALPPVALWSVLAWRRTAAGMAPAEVYRHPHLLKAPVAIRGPAPRRWPALLNTLAFAMMVLALAQPRQPGPWIQPGPMGRDLMLVIDTSETMSTDDFRLNGQPVDRITMLKAVMDRFIAKRAGDRIGIIAFGSQAATLAPPTQDRGYLVAQLNRLQVGFLGPNTALGDALGLALKQVRQRRLRPALILVSDGGDSNAGQITPAEAVAVARRLGVAIYSVQVGSDLFAQGRAPASQAVTQPNLADIARLTGGNFYFVRTTADVDAAISAIGRLEKTLSPPPRQREVREWYWLPLLAAALLLSLARLAVLRGRWP